MGAGEATGAHATGGQKALGHAGGRGLTVSAGDVDGAVGALGVAQEIEDGFDTLQRGLDLVLGCTGEDLGLDLAHADGDLDGAGGSLQVAQVLVLGGIRKLRLPGLPVVGVVSIDLGEELLEAIGAPTGDHVGGDELAQGLEVLAVPGLVIGLQLVTGFLELGD